MLKKSISAAALAAALILAPSAAFAVSASPTPSPYAGQDTQSDTAAPGAPVTFTSEQTNLEQGTPIDITVDGPTSVTFQTAVLSTSSTEVGADGTFSFTVTTPADAAPGSVYTGEATGTDDLLNTYTLDFTITIAAADADGEAEGDGDGAGLPVTGAADTGALVWFGLGALALGVAAVSVVAVKRRQTV